MEVVVHPPMRGCHHQFQAKNLIPSLLAQVRPRSLIVFFIRYHLGILKTNLNREGLGLKSGL